MEVQMDRQMKQQSSNGGSQSTFVDHLIQHTISLWPKSDEQRVFCTGVTDGRTDRRTDGPSYRDAFLTDASKNSKNQGTQSIKDAKNSHNFDCREERLNFYHFAQFKYV